MQGKLENAQAGNAHVFQRYKEPSGTNGKAQKVVLHVPNLGVTGSSPVGRANKIKDLEFWAA